MHTMKRKVSKGGTKKAAGGLSNGIGKAGGGKRKGASNGTAGLKMRASKALELIPKRFVTSESVANLNNDEIKTIVQELVREAFGEQRLSMSSDTMNLKPHTKSTTMDRSQAAADIAVLCKEKNIVTILKTYGVLQQIEMMLMPKGIASMFANADGTTNGGGMRKIASSISLASMGSNSALNTMANGDGDSFTNMTDSKRGKETPADAREGSLLILRALLQICGKKAEPFVVPLLAPVLDESSSSNSAVRQASEDTAKTIIAKVNPRAVPRLVCPVLFAAIKSPEWRVKVAALECITQLSSVAPVQVCKLLPQIIPNVTDTVWDTKTQVSKAATNCLHVACNTNINPDVKPAIPAVVNAIAKPTETNKAVEELMATTFVATVDASTLAILCPVLSRGLKEKLAIHKRSCCLVIQNMSKLVETPEAVAPFGPLLVPDLKKVAENVQFEEIRDTALAALRTLTKALGHASIDDAISTIMEEESKRVAEEQVRIQEERDAEAKRIEEQEKKEEEERKLWREAMEAQRLLDKMALEEEEEKKKEAKKKKEKEKKSTKSTTGVCKSCGLKKCKKTCLFA